MRIGFFLRHRFHDAIMRPIYDLLKEQYDCHMFVPGPADLQRDPFGLEPLRILVEEMIAFRPHVVLGGENINSLGLRRYLPTSIFVHTRHGLASKGITYESVKAVDYACVTSPFMRDWYIEAGAMPRCGFWLVGYPQMDALFTPQILPFALPAGKRVVLYAPTFQASLSSARLLGSRTVNLIRGERQDVCLIIKPHPPIGNLFPQWLAEWRRLAATEPDVYLVEDTHKDVMPFLQAADVLVTDLSSVSLEFLALKRPMVLITSPHINEEPFVDRNGLEWRWRDMGEEIFNITELPAAVARALDQPEIGQTRREYYCDLLFGNQCDGRSGQRLAEHVAELTNEVSSEWEMALGAALGSFQLNLSKGKVEVRIWRDLLRQRMKALVA